MASLFNLLFFAAVIGALMATFRKRYNTYYLSPDDDLYNAGGDSEDDEDNGFSSSARLRPLPDGFLPIKGETPPPVRPKPALLRPVAWTLALCFMVYTFVQMPSDVWETGRHAKIAASEDPDAPVLPQVRRVALPYTLRQQIEEVQHRDLSETANQQPVPDTYQWKQAGYALRLYICTSADGLEALRQCLNRTDIYGIQVEANSFWACLLPPEGVGPHLLEKEWHRHRREWEKYGLEPQIVDLGSSCRIVGIPEKTVLCRCGN